MFSKELDLSKRKTKTAFSGSKFENGWNDWKFLEKSWQCLIMFDNVCKWLEMIEKFLKKFENVWKVWKCLKMLDYVWNFLKIVKKWKISEIDHPLIYHGLREGSCLCTR